MAFLKLFCGSARIHQRRSNKSGKSIAYYQVNLSGFFTRSSPDIREDFRQCLLHVSGSSGSTLEVAVYQRSVMHVAMAYLYTAVAIDIPPRLVDRSLDQRVTREACASMR